MTSSTFLSCPFKMLAAATELALEKDFKASSMFIKMARDTASDEQMETVSLLAMCVTSELSRAMSGSTIHKKKQTYRIFNSAVLV